MLTAVTGINWGDEGKGRVIDLLAEHADVVARYQGGNNAGHTVVTEQGKFILNLLPSGILHPDVTCVLGAGMVIDLDHLAGEMDAIEQRGITVVVSSHVLDQLGRIATRYGVIDAGRMVCEMTANEVTQACGDYLVVRTAEPERTLALLAEAYPGIACTVLPDGTLRLRGVSEERAALDATVFGTFLAANNIPVYELRVHERDLEDYFLELMGGDAAHV